MDAVLARRGPVVGSVLIALLLHGALFSGLWLMPVGRRLGQVTGGVRLSNLGNNGLTWFKLQPLPEGSSLVLMASARKSALPPAGSDGLPDGELQLGDDAIFPGGKGDAPLSDAELAELLAADREALRAELDRMSRVAQAETLPSVDRPLPQVSYAGRNGASDKGPQGAVRELNLEGFPQKVVDEIMERYDLRVVLQTIKAGRRGQSFLSSAASGGDQYFGGLTVPAGVYEVFQLSRETVALMSRLEEQALRERGFEPLKARVIRIVFGIVESKKGGYELGVKSLEAEEVLP